jgi:hypothetical protein
MSSDTAHAARAKAKRIMTTSSCAGIVLMLAMFALIARKGELGRRGVMTGTAALFVIWMILVGWTLWSLKRCAAQARGDDPGEE